MRPDPDGTRRGVKLRRVPGHRTYNLMNGKRFLFLAIAQTVLFLLQLTKILFELALPLCE
jgi:hypothetical protein